MDRRGKVWSWTRRYGPALDPDVIHFLCDKKFGHRMVFSSGGFAHPVDTDAIIPRNTILR